MRARRRFTADFKARVALEALRGGKSIQKISNPSQVTPKSGVHLEAPGDGWPGSGIFGRRRQGRVGSGSGGPMICTPKSTN